MTVGYFDNSPQIEIYDLLGQPAFLISDNLKRLFALPSLSLREKQFQTAGQFTGVCGKMFSLATLELAGRIVTFCDARIRRVLGMDYFELMVDPSISNPIQIQHVDRSVYKNDATHEEFDTTPKMTVGYFDK